jgi:fructosamine-3-kinase
MNLQFQQHVQNQLITKLSKNLIFDWHPISGGSINKTFKITANNYSFFIKVNTITVFKNGFNEEVLGLQFLKANGAITPKVILEGRFDNYIYLILSYIDSAFQKPQFWESFALQVANLHQHKGKQFGLGYDNFMGQLTQKNRYCTNFSTFFIENRLQPQVQLAVETGLFQTKDIPSFERLYNRLPSIFPVEEPSAIHGDLWSGNFIATVNNKAVFIDPAVYYGHREIDIAMSLLFGGFSELFYQIYQQVYPLENGFYKRKDIYNLYPLLIHLNLFGKSYLKNIKTIVSKF